MKTTIKKIRSPRELSFLWEVVFAAILFISQAEAVVLGDKPAKYWAVTFDNDILVPGQRDQDYTYGFNLSIKGEQSTRHWLSLHGFSRGLDSLLGMHRSPIVSSRIEYGLYGFTPEDIEQSAVIQGDRPYAGLIYSASSNEYIDPAANVSWSSTLTVGLLGTDLVGGIQKQVHNLTGSDAPQGWRHQISKGGEFTAKYSVSRQKHVTENIKGLQVKTTLQASVGYITEASWSISGRVGKIHSDWVSFSPELASYGEQSSPAPQAKFSERFFWAGIAIKARAYNAFFQGQFRSSELEYSASDLNHGLVETWAGYTVALDNGYRFTYSIRGHSSELKQGQGKRNVVWGGLQISKALSNVNL